MDFGISIPPPPPLGKNYSAPLPPREQRLREVALLKDVESRRTPELDAQAIRLADDGQVKIWKGYVADYRKHAGTKDAARGAFLVGQAMLKAFQITKRQKHQHDAPRPWQLDKTLTTVGDRPGDASFPSGHTSASFAAATVLAHLWPERGPEFLGTADAIGQSRMYAGMHLPSDVAAGKAIGLAVGRNVIDDALDRDEAAPVVV